MINFRKKTFFFFCLKLNRVEIAPAQSSEVETISKKSLNNYEIILSDEDEIDELQLKLAKEVSSCSTKLPDNKRKLSVVLNEDDEESLTGEDENSISSIQKKPIENWSVNECMYALKFINNEILFNDNILSK